MRLKKILIGTSVGLLAASPLIALAFINAFPKETKVSDRFIIEPESEQTKDIQAKVKKALDDTIGPNGKLELDYYTLYMPSQFTPSKLSWFSEVEKAMAWLDPRIDFTMIPRSTKTLKTAYDYKNGQMITFWWSPDYHNLGTWLGFWFKRDYALPNLWVPLYNHIKDLDVKGELDKPENAVFKDVKRIMFEDGTLFTAEQLKNKPYLTDKKNFYPENPLAPKEAVPVVPGEESASFFQSTEALTWIDHLNKVKGKKGTKLAEKTADIMAYWFDTLDDKKLGIDLIAWMDDQAGMLPFFASGPTSTLKSLVRHGYHNPKNSYTNTTYRDWYYLGEKDTAKNPFRMWTAADPFKTNKTPYNASFNESPNNLFFESTYNGLVDWRIKGDWTLSQDGNWKAPEGDLILSAATKIKAEPGGYSFPKTPISPSSKPEDFVIHRPEDSWTDLENATTYTFTVDPNRFSYYDYTGKPVSKVMARDYFWSFVGYKLSVDLDFAKNYYFLDMMNVDWTETVKANPTFYDFHNSLIPEPYLYSSWNLKPKLEGNSDDFVVVLSEPNINFIDILTSQYFQPTPIENKEAQNLFLGLQGDKLVYKLKIEKNEQTNKEELHVVWDADNTKLDQLYGAGSEFSNYKDWWSPGPYYVSNVTEQDMRFDINDSYFKQFPELMFKQSIDEQKAASVPANEQGEQKKIRSVTTKYGGAYSEQLTFEQFKANELDYSKIPFSEYGYVINNQKENFRTEGVFALDKTDLIPYNTNVFLMDDNTGYYQKWSSAYPQSRKVVLDNGDTRVLKDLIPQDYYKAIVKDFYVPGGNSETIRKGILNVLDWYSLAALAVPDDSPSFQNSVLPYGNFRWDTTTGIPGVPETTGNNAASSYYELTMKHTDKYGLVRRGTEFKRPAEQMVHDSQYWTFDSYIWWWEKQFRKK